MSRSIDSPTLKRIRDAYEDHDEEFMRSSSLPLTPLTSNAADNQPAASAQAKAIPTEADGHCITVAVASMAQSPAPAPEAEAASPMPSESQPGSEDNLPLPSPSPSAQPQPQQNRSRPAAKRQKDFHAHQQQRQNGQSAGCEWCIDKGMGPKESSDHAIIDCHFKKAHDAMQAFELAEALAKESKEAEIARVTARLEAQHAEEIAELKGKHLAEMALSKAGIDGDFYEIEESYQQRYDIDVGALEAELEEVKEKLAEKVPVVDIDLSLRAEYDAKIASLESELEQAAAKLEDKDAQLEQNEANLDSMQGTVELQTVYLRDQKVNHEQVVKKLSAEYDLQIKDLRAEYSFLGEQLDDYRGDLAEKNKQLARSQEEVFECKTRLGAKETELATSQADLLKQSSDMDKLEGSHAEMLKIMRQGYDAAVDNLRNEHSQQIETLKGELVAKDLRISNLEEALMAQLKDDQTLRVREMEKVQKQHAANIAEINEKHAQQLASLQEELAGKDEEISTMEEIVEAQTKGIDKQDESHKKMLDGLQSEHEAQLIRLRDEHATEIDDLREQLAAKDAEISELNDIVDAHDDEMNSQASKLQIESGTALSNLRDQHADKIRDMIKTFAEEREEFHEQWNHVQEEITASNRELAEKCEELADYEDRWETMFAEQEQRHEAEIADYREKMLAIEESSREESANLCQQLGNLEVERHNLERERDDMEIERDNMAGDLADCEDKWKARFAEQKQNHETELVDHREKIQDLEESSREESAKLYQQLHDLEAKRRNLERERGDMADELADCEDKWKARLGEWEECHKTQVAKLEEEHAKTIRNMEDVIVKERDGLRQKLAELAARNLEMNQKLDALVLQSHEEKQNLAELDKRRKEDLVAQADSHLESVRLMKSQFAKEMAYVELKASYLELKKQELKGVIDELRIKLAAAQGEVSYLAVDDDSSDDESYQAGDDDSSVDDSSDDESRSQNSNGDYPSDYPSDPTRSTATDSSDTSSDDESEEDEEGHPASSRERTPSTDSVRPASNYGPLYRPEWNPASPGEETPTAYDDLYPDDPFTAVSPATPPPAFLEPYPYPDDLSHIRYVPFPATGVPVMSGALPPPHEHFHQPTYPSFVPNQAQDPNPEPVRQQEEQAESDADSSDTLDFEDNDY